MKIYPSPPYPEGDNRNACYQVYTSFIIALLITSIMTLFIVLLTDKINHSSGSDSGSY